MAGEEEEKAAEPEKKSRFALWAIVGMSLLLLGVGGFIAWSYLGDSKPASADSEIKSDAELSQEAVKSVMKLDAFLVNLADRDSPRFVKATFSLGLDNGEGERLAEDPVVLAAARDKINSILSTKTADELLTPEGKQGLRKEIQGTVNGVLHEAKVVEVYIVDFVVQL